jgi:hypothetical protein
MMNQAQLRRCAGAAGIVFVIVIVISFIFGPGDPPGFDEPAEEVAGFVEDNRGELQAAAALSVAAGPFFLFFLAGLARELRIAEGPGPAMLAAAAFAGGILLEVFVVTDAALRWAASYHSDLDAGLIQALLDAGNISVVFAIGIGSTTLIGASSAVALASGALPRALGAYGALLAVFSFVVGIVAALSETGAFSPSPSDGALGVIAFLGFLVWVLLTGLALLARPGAAAEPARAQA